MELQRVGHSWATKHNIYIHTCASSRNHSKLQILIQSVWDGAWGSSHSGTLRCWRIHHPKLHFESQHPAVTSLQREVRDQDEGLTGRRQWSASAFGKGWVRLCRQLSNQLPAKLGVGVGAQWWDQRWWTRCWGAWIFLDQLSFFN